MIVELLFWIAFVGAVYAYFGYPVLLAVIARVMEPRSDLVADKDCPSVTFLIPAYNEEAVIAGKLENTQALDYPEDRIEIIVVSDGSSDGTDSIVKEFQGKYPVKFYRVESRKGKANALNIGLQHASGDIVVFSDSSIMLEKNSLKHITKGFADRKIGCISGEDHIPGGGGEGLYGRYELYLRNLESKSGSIVGASGSFYAQRKELCSPFIEGLAPDFLSVLNTVEQGYRAVSESSARGEMSAVKNPQDEFRRKVRTLLRGMTTLWEKRHLMNPLQYGYFAFVLLSHKLMRWLVPAFLLIMLIANTFLLSSPVYLTIFCLQILFYGLAMMAWWHWGSIDKRIFGKVPLYFTVVNVAILQAWLLFLKGVRQEIWEPSKRVS